ncbi:MAG: class I SAM-dependent methyltransferase [Alphaproteobacteria bacterium]
MDPVAKTLFAPFEPLHGVGVFANARMHPGLAHSMVLHQGFRPYARELQSEGFSMISELPASGEFSHGFVLLPKNVDEARYDVARVLKILNKAGVIAIAGANDAGGKRAKRILADFGVEDIQEHAANHARVAWGVKRGENEAVEKALIEGAPSMVAATGFISQPGLFAWDKIDKGSEILAAHLPNDLRGTGADFGCGYGFLSRYVLQACENIRSFSCVDADYRAVQACRKNMEGVQAPVRYFWEDLAKESPARDLDFIVMNPPFHEGKTTDADIGKRFIETARNSLRHGGQLWMVANVNLPYEEDARALFSSCQKITEKNGFKIFRAVR